MYHIGQMVWWGKGQNNGYWFSGTVVAVQGDLLVIEREGERIEKYAFEVVFKVN